jgi:plastocyanin
MAHKQWRALALTLTAFALCSVLLVACIRPGTASTSGGSSTSPSATNNSCASGDTVKTATTDFEQNCITLSKGSTLKIVQGQTSFHILDYGQWNNGTPEPESPSNVPALKDLQLSGPSVEIGPFTIAGTFHIYCTVHPGMNLTVIVK